MATNEDILIALNEIKVDIAHTKTDIAVMKTMASEVRELVGKHEHAIYGNGTPGIKTDISTLKSSKKRQDFWINTALAAAIISFVKAFISLIKHTPNS